MIEKIYSMKSIPSMLLDIVRSKSLSSTIQTIEIGGFIIGKVTRQKHTSSSVFNFFIKNYEIEVVDFIHCANISLTDKEHFRLKYKDYKEEVLKHFQESNGEHKIIGEWHSHPSKNPYPSEMDDEEVNKKLMFHKIYLAGIVSLSPKTDNLFNFNLFLYRKKGFFGKLIKTYEVGYTWERTIKIAGK
ncbi:hypothetical protein BH10BAC5_BH10BAC5_17060 [soil metagenome]